MAALPIAATIAVSAGGSQTSAMAFHGWSGWPPALQQEIELASRPGQDGTVAQGMGRKSAPTEITAYRFALNKDLAVAFCASVESLPATAPYRTTDPWGRTYLLRVHNARVSLSSIRGPVDGTNQTTHLITVQLTVERMPDV